MVVTCCCAYQLNMILKISGEGAIIRLPPLNQYQALALCTLIKLDGNFTDN